MPVPLHEAPDDSGVVLQSAYRHVHRYLQRRVRLSTDADDLAQEVCARFVQCSRSRAVEAPLRYLLGIAHHVLSDFRKSTARQRRLIDVDSESDGFLNASVTVDPIRQRMAELDLSRLMARLPKMHGAVVTSCCLQGRSYVEAASELGLTVLTVEKYLNQSRAQMRMSKEVRELKG